MRWISRSFFAIIILLFSVAIFFLTPAGFHWGIKFAQDQLPGELTFKSITGNIFGPINIKELHYNSKTLDFSAKNAHLEWRLPMLLLGKLDISYFYADKINITNKNAGTTTTPPAEKPKPKKLKLPLGLLVETARIDDITYQPSGSNKIFHIGKITLNRFKLTKNKIRGLIRIHLKKPYAVDSAILLNGKLSDYHFTWTLTANHEKLVAIGHGNRGGATISINNNHLLGGVAHVMVSADWYPAIRWKSMISLTDINLASVAPSLPHIQAVSVNSDGNWEKSIPTFNINASLHIGNNTLEIKGAHQKKWDLRWNASLDNLQQLLKNNQGRAHTQGTITGENLTPIIHSTFDVHKLKISTNNYIGHLSGETTLDLSWKTPSKITFSGKGIDTSALHARQLNITLASERELEKVNAHIQLKTNHFKNLAVTTELKGKLNGMLWQGTIAQLNILNENNSWTLQQPSVLSFSQQQVKLQKMCLSAEASHACFDLAWDNKNSWNIDGKGHLKDLNVIAQLLSPYITAQAAADFTFHINNGENKVAINFNTQGGTISYRRDFESFTIPFKNMQLSAVTKDHDLTASFTASTTQKDYIKANISLPNFSDSSNQLKSRAIKGDIKLHFSKLQILQFFIPYISQPTGIIEGNIAIGGTIGDPNLQGKLALLNGHVDVPSLKIQLKNFQLGMSAKNHIIDYNASANSDGKTITITGKTTILPDKLITEINLKANDILVSNTSEYTIYATADLKLKLIGQSSILTGSIIIPNALIKPADFSSTVSLPDDVVVIKHASTAEKSTPSWLANLTITLGDKIIIDSHGLKTRLTGNLHITRNANQDRATATGQLHLVDASFSAQGKELKISDDSFISYLQDPLNNPHLNIRAYRKVRILATRETSPIGLTEAEVGVSIKGTVKHPHVTMFSSPVTLSQADILSYLLFNQPASGSSSTNISLILQAAQSLKLNDKSKGSSFNQIQQSLNITELGVQQQLSIDALGSPLGINQSAFVVGKYITPNIYIRYNRGLVTPVDIYELRYIINKNWAIQTEIGSKDIVGAGMDILYNIRCKRFPWKRCH